ncbi:pyridine nucleotide-disulphide oxidoreductase, putative [Eimeria acervulina]|uniref:NADH:ubiquinone reductase (non-electrogenic) n=1 Tax=Eimeria acervulina TaxID=5801 RepID=U6GAX3_EIMAC|nr:pyridine nucleotide-disulphide oxidoreductase, putative [Eimeria acervulina]CDI76662.1 pyridine nucleotide-disulphide oxidoreductase, putative [Eimeria acervulina]
MLRLPHHLHAVLSRSRLGVPRVFSRPFSDPQLHFATSPSLDNASPAAAAAVNSASMPPPEQHQQEQQYQPSGAHRREHVVVLGTGWAAVNFFRDLDPDKFDVTVISPRNYFTFTPLLPSVCAGTLTPLSCIEPVRGFSRDSKGRRLLQFYEAHATDIDFTNKLVACTSRCSQFKVQYDKLVVAVGTDANTYGVPGVEANAFFLKEVEQAVQIRKRVMSNFETAALPTTDPKEQERLLHFVIVGGGPTGVETAAEFADFIREDMQRIFPELMPRVTITLIEGGSRVLPTYAAAISKYAASVLTDVLRELRRVGVLVEAGAASSSADISSA